MQDVNMIEVDANHNFRPMAVSYKQATMDLNYFMEQHKDKVLKKVSLSFREVDEISMTYLKGVAAHLKRHNDIEWLLVHSNHPSTPTFILQRLVPTVQVLDKGNSPFFD